MKALNKVLFLLMLSCISSGVFALDSITFSGYIWDVKAALTPAAPGPNYFSSSKRNVFVDNEGRLHVKIVKRKDRWYCSEVISRKSFGYGTYIFYVDTDFTVLDPQIVVGLFTWDSTGGEYNREIDIEFSRWGEIENNWNTQFVVQPTTSSSRLFRFSMIPAEKGSTHVLNWQEDRIAFRSYQGHIEQEQIVEDIGNEKETSFGLVRQWVFRGTPFPRPGSEQIRCNFYLYKGKSPIYNDKEEHEFVLSGFSYIP